MSKKYSKTTTTLVIVESPAKCKKIEEYLGPGYKCIASFGHLRELPSLKNIDIENKFSPSFTIIDVPTKKKQIELLRKEIKKADDVILATDDDREGEGIAWHLCQLFKLDIENTKRIIFNEITETALKKAVKNPRIVDMNMVYAQQARQILDILVGFKISPILWKCIVKGKDNALSAGRCQTPALRILYDNDREIKEVVSKKIYNTTGYFTNLNLAFELNKDFEKEEDITDFLDGSINFKHILTCETPVKILKQPPEPFTTSRIQQVASNELHYSPKETMKICQKLYEGGFITYMRTDSKTYSGEFICDVKNYIRRQYGADGKYINENIDTLGLQRLDPDIKNDKNKKGVVTQDAHEAIRPSKISLYELPEDMDSKEKRMYKLIWENTLESCMAKASFYSITASIHAFQNAKFTYKSEQVEFAGWKIVSKKHLNEIREDNKEYRYLQMIKQNIETPYKKMIAKATIKGTKLHYTEARLVQLLEEKGIGRPSTFSSIIDKIQERGYVKKEDVKGKEIICNDYELENGEIFEIEKKREFGNEKNKLVIQPLGIIVVEFLEKHFNELFDYNYTCKMEDSLDKISKGQIEWHEICGNCNNQIDTLIESMGDQGKLEIQLDENNTYLIGKYGPVIKCVEEKDGKEEITFKPVKKDLDIDQIKNKMYKLEEIIDNKKTTGQASYVLGQYEGKDIIVKKGKFGVYVSCGTISKNLKEFGNRPIENINLDEVLPILQEGSNLIREINSNISIRKGPKGDYLFYKNGKMKKPQFYDIKSFQNDTKEDYKICDIIILKSWIKEKYNI
jgi:DNA topoisomerase-1